MRFRLVPLIACACLVPACSNTTEPPPSQPPIDIGQGLNELGEVYKYRAAQKLPAPAKADDLAEHDAALENALKPIQDGRIVVVWRVGYTPSSTDVLAYEKSAPTEGGKVLLRNGTVKQMAAEEFRAAKR